VSDPLPPTRFSMLENVKPPSRLPPLVLEMRQAFVVFGPASVLLPSPPFKIAVVPDGSAVTLNVSLPLPALTNEARKPLKVMGAEPERVSVLPTSVNCCPTVVPISCTYSRFQPPWALTVTGACTSSRRLAVLPTWTVLVPLLPPATLTVVATEVP